MSIADPESKAPPAPAAPAAGTVAPPGRHLVEGPILPTLLGLALPNMAAYLILSLAAIAETGLVGRLGSEALAAMALVYPLIAFTQMVTGAAIGGGVSSAISRALGAGDMARARALAIHAIAIALVAGLATTALMLSWGRDLYAALGAGTGVLEQAVLYGNAFFAGALATWLFQLLTSIVRGTGEVRLASAIHAITAALQVLIAAALSLDLEPLPALGMAGIGLAWPLAQGIGCLLLLVHLCRPRARFRLGLSGVRPDAELLHDILKVGAVACLSPVQSILVVLILARVAAELGTTALAGFGIGLRLELLLMPVTFAFGVAATPMVGMATGSGRIARARRVAWTASALAGGIAGMAGIAMALAPRNAGLVFTTDPAVLAAVDAYLGIAGWAFGAYAFGSCLFLAAQGSGHVLGPVLAGTVRLIIVAACGWSLLTHGGTLTEFAAVVAASLAAFGLTAWLLVAMTRWGPRARR